ncbi:autotransporter domain-containing protein [Desulfovibrio sp. OttesenSCG-928-G15]|nr:autotransporter domain-containing protein [Desulfovibrio sp. OttesenSCG-928-G15]
MSRFPVCLCFVCFFAACLFTAGFAHAGASSFRTSEYLSSTGLESIQAAKAYARGFTGKGVILGFIDDSFAAPREEFFGKYPRGVFGETTFGYHGIHVSGIMAAKKDTLGMHGVAFDAQLLPYAWQTDPIPGLHEMLRHPEIRIINNSWTIGYHLDSRYKPGFWDTVLQMNAELVTAAGKLARQDKLIIMAAGNEGHLAPSFVAGLPTVLEWTGLKKDPGIRNNWLNVAAFNPAYSPNHPAFVWTSTNMGFDAAEYTLMAPGVNIYSTIAPRKYQRESGTSMATPYVSGVAGLVQEAFPYMGGKQIADVLLSTATPMKGKNQPPYFVLMRETNGATGAYIEVIAYSTGKIRSTQEEKEAILKQLRAYSPWDIKTLRASLDRAIDNPALLTPEIYNEAFGQGIVNADKAVQGPGYFDASRLDTVKDLDSNSFGAKYAMYRVDSKGFDSVWSNNIGERQASSGALANLGVGLRKDGAGMLHMTGVNTYTGPTEVRGGGISLGPAASLAADVYVRPKGLFTGSGTVKGNLYSTGTLLPGQAAVPGTTLAVRGEVQSAGVLRLTLGQNGLANHMTAGAIHLNGSTLQIGRAKGHAIEPYTDYNNVLTATKGIDGLASLPATLSASPFLSYRIALKGGRSLSLLAETKDLDSLPGMHSRTRAVAGALQHMFDGLRGSASQNRLDFLYGQSREEFEQTLSDLRGDLHAATLTNLPFSGLLGKLTTPGLLRPRAEAAPPDGGQNLALASGGTGGAAEPQAAFNLWMRPVLGYAKTRGRSSLFQEDVANHMRGITVGLQRNTDIFHAGGLFAIGDGKVEQGRNSADIIDARIGLYGGYSPDGLNISGLVSAGWQQYTTDRRIFTGTGNKYLRSNFDGYSLGLGAKASYNLLHTMSDRLALAPYADFEADHIHQPGRRESGDKLFALNVDSKNYWRTSISPGVRLEFAPSRWISINASGGYKRLLSGRNPTIDAGFRAESSYRFKAVGADEGRDFVTYGLNLETTLPRKLKLAAGFFGENSARSKAYSGYVNMSFEW